MAYNKVRFKCSECGNEYWFEVNLEDYIVKVEDLVCDDCLPEEEE